MAEMHPSLQSEVLDLKIENLQKEKEIKSLRRRISDLESGTSTTGLVQSRVQVAHISSHGKVQFQGSDERDSAYSVVTAATEDSSSRPSTDQHENKVINLETKKHAHSFHFEQANEWIRKLKGEVSDLQDEMRRRNCLAKAIRMSCPDITSAIPMQGGLFLDQLVAASCLDEEEGKLVSRSRKNDTNQVRAVLVIVLKKDFVTILAFVSCIREVDKTLGEKIVESYQQLASSDLGAEDKCWACLLKARVKFEIIVDNLMSESCIDDEDLMEASREDIDAAGRQAVWDKLFKQLMTHANAQQIMECIRRAIDKSGVHRDIVSLISRDIDGGRFDLRCGCGPQLQLLKPYQEDTNKDSGNNSFMHSANEHNHNGDASPSSMEDRSSGFDDN